MAYIKKLSKDDIRERIFKGVEVDSLESVIEKLNEVIEELNSRNTYEFDYCEKRSDDVIEDEL